METTARFVICRQELTDADVDAWMADLRERGAEDDYLFSMNLPDQPQPPQPGLRRPHLHFAESPDPAR
jgi:hypothetical protein